MQTTASARIIAHRGARSLAPENTMAAIDKAWEVGAGGIEIDVRASADRVIVLLHDPTPARTTDVGQVFPGRKDATIDTFSLAEIGRLDAGSWFVDTDPFGEIRAGRVSAAEQQAMRGLRLPTLEEVLQFVGRRAWHLNVEIKELDGPGLLERLLELIDEARLEPGALAISSFRHDYLRRIRQLRPDIEINALIGASPGKPQQWGDFEFAVYNADAARTDLRQIETALAHGCRVNLYTVNDPAQARRFLNAGVARIITDYPQRLLPLAG